MKDSLDTPFTVLEQLCLFEQSSSYERAVRLALGDLGEQDHVEDFPEVYSGLCDCLVEEGTESLRAVRFQG